MLCHIIAASDWAAVEATGGPYEPPSVVSEGFIHFSAPGQVLATLDRHYVGAEDLILLIVDPAGLGDLRYDDVVRPDGSTEVFAHLYQPLGVDHVVTTIAVEVGAGGRRGVRPAGNAQSELLEDLLAVLVLDDFESDDDEPEDPESLLADELEVEEPDLDESDLEGSDLEDSDLEDPAEPRSEPPEDEPRASFL